MIYTLGDSHASIPFEDVPGVTRQFLGPVTLRRICHLEDDLLPTAVAQLGLTPADVLVLSFGEIDIRCHVKPLMDHRRISLDDLLRGWAEPYALRALTLRTQGARVALLSISPPATRERSLNAELPVAGTDEERALYTRTLNGWLQKLATDCGLCYLDTYSLGVDDHGMLRPDLSDGYVHLRATELLTALLRGHGWIP